MKTFTLIVYFVLRESLFDMKEWKDIDKEEKDNDVLNSLSSSLFLES